MKKSLKVVAACVAICLLLAGHQDHKPGSVKDRYGLGTICFVYTLCDVVFFPVRDGRELGCVIH